MDDIRRFANVLSCVGDGKSCQKISYQLLFRYVKLLYKNYIFILVIARSM